MRVLIIEDETPSAERLRALLKKYDSDIQVLAMLDSVRAAVDWLKSHTAPELAFFDIQLADGLSFEIFEQTEVPCPVIFTTAYDEYAIRAFKVHSVDYLLKPVNYQELCGAFQQYQRQQKGLDAPALQKALQALQFPDQKYRERFMIKTGSQLISVGVGDILYFYSENKITWLQHSSGKRYAVDFPLDQLQEMLDPHRFFRINRQVILCWEALERVTDYTNSRLKVSLPHWEGEKVIVSRERVPDFKRWLDGQAH